MTGPASPSYRWTLARFLRVTVAKLLVLLFRVRAIGLENLPDGGAILAGNHQSYADPVLLWCKTPRPAHFMAKAELWEVPIVGWVVARVWAFPVRRGAADREAIRTAVELVQEGELVGVFPEGTRHQAEGLGEAHGGAAFVAMRSGAPIVPVGIAGTDRIMPEGKRFIRFPRVTMSFGAPLYPSHYDHLGRKDRVTMMTGEIMRRIAAQIETAKEV